MSHTLMSFWPEIPLMIISSFVGLFIGKIANNRVDNLIHEVKMIGMDGNPHESHEGMELLPSIQRCNSSHDPVELRRIIDIVLDHFLPFTGDSDEPDT